VDKKIKMNRFIDQIICGDAERVLAEMPDSFVHMVITSPPYNTGIQYDSHNDRMDYKEYLEKMKRIFRECYRVLVSGGRIAINCPSVIMQHTGSRVAYLSIDFLLALREVGFLDREMITWVKSGRNDELCSLQPAGKSTSWGSWRSCSNPSVRDVSEFIIVMHKETPKLEGDKLMIDITANEFMRYTTNAWFMRPELENRNLHPAPFPKQLPYRLMKLYTYRGNIILDPFCGIGTTCLTAKENGRHYIGIDISENYCKIARDRLRQELIFDDIKKEEVTCEP